MTAKQRFWLIIVLVLLVVAGIASTTVAVVVDGVNASNSPSVAFVTGTGTAVILVIIGLLQNGAIQQTVNETKTIVNGGLALRVETLVNDIMHKAPITVAVPVTVGAPAPGEPVEPQTGQAPQ